MCCGIRPRPYPSIKTLAKKAINDACGSARLLQPNSTSLTSALLIFSNNRADAIQARARTISALSRNPSGGFPIIFIVATTTNQDQQPPLGDQPQQQLLSQHHWWPAVLSFRYLTTLTIAVKFQIPARHFPEILRPIHTTLAATALPCRAALLPCRPDCSSRLGA